MNYLKLPLAALCAFSGINASQSNSSLHQAVKESAGYEFKSSEATRLLLESKMRQSSGFLRNYGAQLPKVGTPFAQTIFAVTTLGMGAYFGKAHLDQYVINNNNAARQIEISAANQKIAEENQKIAQEQLEIAKSGNALSKIQTSANIGAVIGAGIGGAIGGASAGPVGVAVGAAIGGGIFASITANEVLPKVNNVVTAGSSDSLDYFGTTENNTKSI